MACHSLPSLGLSGKADNSWEWGEFIVKVSLPEPTHTLPGHPLIQCEAPATDWTGCPGRLGVGQPKPFVYTSPSEIRLLLMRRERWIFNNHGVILTLIHGLGPPFFSVVIRTHTRNLEWEACPYQKNTPPAVGLKPAIHRSKLLPTATNKWHKELILKTEARDDRDSILSKCLLESFSMKYLNFTESIATHWSTIKIIHGFN